MTLEQYVKQLEFKNELLVFKGIEASTVSDMRRDILIQFNLRLQFGYPPFMPNNIQIAIISHDYTEHTSVLSKNESTPKQILDSVIELLRKAYESKTLSNSNS